MIEEATPVEVKKLKATVPLDRELHKKLAALAKAKRYSLGEYIEEIAAKFVAAQERKAAK